MIFAIIAAWMAYRRAKDSERNGFLWALITAVAFIGTQLLVSVGAGVIIGFSMGSEDLAQQTFEKFNLLITAIAIVASIIVAMLILRYLSHIPDEPTYAAPPEPPKFG